MNIFGQKHVFPGTELEFIYLTQEFIHKTAWYVVQILVWTDSLDLDGDGKISLRNRGDFLEEISLMNLSDLEKAKWELRMAITHEIQWEIMQSYYQAMAAAEISRIAGRKWKNTPFSYTPHLIKETRNSLDKIMRLNEMLLQYFVMYTFVTTKKWV